MKVFVLDRQRPRVFWVRQLGAGGLRLVWESCDETILAGGGDMQQRTAHRASTSSEVTDNDVVEGALPVITTPNVEPARIASPNLSPSNHS